MAVLIAKNGEKILVDDIDYERASKYKWYVYKDGSKSYCIVTKIKRRQLRFSKLVFDMEEHDVLYHKNGDPLDNTRENIIICDRSLLGHFTNVYQNKASRYSGVYFSKSNNRWCVIIHKGCHSYYGGVFSSEDDAAIVAEHFSIIHYGEQARINFPSMTTSQINERYKTILDKYGRTTEEKVSRSHQGLGREIRGKKTSRFAGVTWIKSDRRWGARIQKLGKYVNIGNFIKEEDAAKAYDKKAIELYGENAKRNFPELTYQQLTERVEALLKENGTTTSEKLSIVNQGIKKSKNREMTSRYVGVSLFKERGKWISRIRYNGKAMHLGYFEKEDDAARAYDKKAIELYGINAKLNFPVTEYIQDL